MSRSPTACLVAGAALLAAGCGGSSSHGGGAKAEADKAPQVILRDARKAAHRAASVHVSGSIASAGKTIRLDFRLAGKKGGGGSASINGMSFQILRIHRTAYVKGSSAFFKHYANATVAHAVGGRWLKVSVDAPNYKSLGPLTDMRSLLAGILTPSGSNLTKGDVRTIRGVKAIGLVDRGQGTLYVAAEGTPYPLEIDGAPGHQGRIVFAEWNRPVALHAPAGALDLRQLGKSG